MSHVTVNLSSDFYVSFVLLCQRKAHYCELCTELRDISITVITIYLSLLMPCCKSLHVKSEAVFDYVTHSNKLEVADTFFSLCSPSPDPREAVDEQEQDHKPENTITMENTSTTLEPVLAFLAHSLATVETTFNKLPGSAVIQRYVRSSHQNDPGRTLLELILIIFAIRTLLQSRTQADRGEKHFIRFTDKVSRVQCLVVLLG